MKCNIKLKKYFKNFKDIPKKNDQFIEKIHQIILLSVLDLLHLKIK